MALHAKGRILIREPQKEPGFYHPVVGRDLMVHVAGVALYLTLIIKGKVLGDLDVLGRDDTGFVAFVIEYLFPVIHDPTVMA
jgi:hypothetical protein